jgi:hypothetical protein
VRRLSEKRDTDAAGFRHIVTGNTVEKTFRAGEKVRSRRSARRGAAHAARGLAPTQTRALAWWRPG